MACHSSSYRFDRHSHVGTDPTTESKMHGIGCTPRAMQQLLESRRRGQQPPHLGYGLFTPLVCIVYSPGAPCLFGPPAGVADPRGMKPSRANFNANLLTRHPREAGPNLLNPFQDPSLPLHMSCPDSNPIGILFLIRPGNFCLVPATGGKSYAQRAPRLAGRRRFMRYPVHALSCRGE